MRKRVLTVAVGILLTAGTGAGTALAAGGPGPNGHNNQGLCNAYFRGSTQGQAQKQSHGQAFIVLAATAAMWDQTQDTNNPETNEPSPESSQEQVQEYCAANG